MHFDSSGVAPPRSTNLTHVRSAGVAYPGEYFRPLPFQPPRFYRGWALSMPVRDDREEEEIYVRNKVAGVNPPLQTLTASVIKLQPKSVTHSARPKVRLKKKMQPFFTLPECSTSSSAASEAEALVQRRHVLNEDKNDWSQLRLLRRGLRSALGENAMHPAGLEGSHGDDWYQGANKEFSSLFPSSDLLHETMYLTTNAAHYPLYDERVAIANMRQAKACSRKQEIDPRARSNTKIRRIYRAEHHRDADR
jgi:hypothetical protein